MIFPNNARKIIFQRNFIGKNIFSGGLEKENMVFRAVITIYINRLSGPTWIMVI